MSVMNPAVPGASYTRFLEERAPSSRSRPEWTEQDGPLPALYLSHGAPPVFDDPHWMGQLFDWSQTLPKPRAILIVSAHWETAPLSLSAAAPATPLVYDFGGFAPVYHTMTYPTPDAGGLARSITSMMPDVEPIHQHTSRGLDHGAWVPLKVMYPYADVPVLQMSMPTHDPQRLFDLGRRLRPLREELAEPARRVTASLTPQLRATIAQTAPLAAEIARLAQANKALMGKVAPPQIESGDDDDQ